MLPCDSFWAFSSAAPLSGDLLAHESRLSTYQPVLFCPATSLAEAAGPCACGRGLPKIRRVLGRTRNLLRLPDGRRLWPLMGVFSYRDIAPVRQYQVVQHDLERVTLRLAVERPLTVAEEEALIEKMLELLDYRFKAEIVYFSPEIPRGPGGKFEDFICEIPD
jgi:phenylacetate-CoA ligase